MKFININGIELSYSDSLDDAVQDAGLPVLLLVHGAGGSLEQYAPQHGHFTGRYRTIVVSLRGHGASGVPAQASKENYALSVMAEDLALFIEALGLAPVHYVGNSAGGVLGFELAIKRPELLASLCTFGTVARMAFPGFLRTFTFWFDNQMIQGKAERKLRSLARYVSKKPEVQAAVGEMFIQAARSIPYFRYALCSYNYLDGLKSLRVPYALIRGGKDADINMGLGPMLRIVRAGRTASGYPCRLFELPEAGHVANMDEPEAFNRILDDWLDGVTA